VEVKGFMKIKSSKLKAAATGIAALVLSVGFGAPAMAQQYQWAPLWPNAPANSALYKFDNGFLREHPDIAQQLANKPNLVDDPTYLNNHPALKDYLNNHPTIESDIKSHPFKFMGREDQVNGWGPGRYGNGYGNGNPPYGWNPGGPNQPGWNPGGPNHPWNPNNPAAYNNAEWRFDNGYLSQHPEVAQELARNPGLVDNPQFLANHPGLQEYLANHPRVAYDLKHHPYYFMGHGEHMNGWHPGAPGYAAPLANTDRYLDQNPQVAQQLAANPSLIDNRAYLNAHPGLEQYLRTHPYAAREWHTHPYKFMNREQHYNRNH